MLKLNSIVKTYQSPGQTINAVDGVSLEFRRNEFVSILGASGSGKTTMLNIIGGLDRYNSGDLVIEGTSTKEYKDSDWDNYRNKRVGFVFQSYNLISHLTLLGNVELALTISGISPSERKQRAKEALVSVGLADHIKKKPNQLSGGQMQRVAIARALVNKPEILLADEPTGALDTTTSEQIMELIKNIATDKLVIMVTHNPELAKAYSNRIVRMSDGIVVEDTNPFEGECTVYSVQCTNNDELRITNDELLSDNCNADMAATNVGAGIDRPHAATPYNDTQFSTTPYNGTIDPNKNQKNKPHKKPKKKKSSMSFLTALSISAKNLLTKKRRSTMTAIASAIGILGIGLILALSTGLNTYISELTRNQVETSPIQISTSTFTQANGAVIESQDNLPLGSSVFIDRTLEPRHRTQVPPYIRYMLQGEGNSFGFDGGSQFNSDWYNYILYRTGMEVNLFRPRIGDNNYFDMIAAPDMSGGMGGMMGGMMGMGGIQQMLCPTLTYRYYELLAGELPTTENQLVLIVNENDAITDTTLMSLGLLGFGDTREGFSFDDILGMQFMLPSNNVLYTPVLDNGQVTNFDPLLPDMMGRTTLSASDMASNQVLTLEIAGIIRLREGNDLGLYATGLAYPAATARWLETQNAESYIIEWMQQDNNLNRNPFNGVVFTPTQTGMFGGTILTAANQWEDIFRSLGGVPIDGITANGLNLGANEIAIYATSLNAKDSINAVLDAYNEGRPAQYQIFYIDIIETLGAMMSEMVGMITWVLIAFTAISLVVSAVMISIITSISVLERTKEIGILRSIGARKKDVTRLFNAENVILGILAGSLGVLITLLLSIPINLLVSAFLGVAGIASLTWWHALILLAVSTGVAFIAGFLPARKAAKKDPVLALRSE